MSEDAEFKNAKRLYVEQYGSAMVTNSYLRIGLLCMSVVLVAQTWFMFRVYDAAKQQKPLVVRIRDVGSAEAVNYESFDYKPQDRELRYFLTQFVTRHYSRMPATLQERYTESLHFLDRKLVNALVEEERKNQHLTKFIRESTEEIDVQVTNISLQELRTPPYKATVDFEKVYYTRADHRELRRERFTGSFEFIVRDQVPNALIPTNPLGLTITYYRADEAFR